ncbi:hypothetical protein [Streptosporangium carneum]|uniref:Protein kinase domain-containing protein n=1 Tax=Streptosporangium carneum TaxID=47481 RepID=A0A9W6HZK6_9ACTN|nr:hypothetical protein [Streptosporangium carneum]GLK08255.1 hypothetical protein GCM10017600_16600 [Streptosporangium carneum]
MSDPSLLAGRYRLLERRDHTGTSWRSRDELLGRDVTISEVRLPPPGPERDRLLGQIRAAADLRHPGVTTLHDVISAPDRMWLVAEAVTGRSLVQTVRTEGPLSSERAAEVGLRVLDALNAAHARGVRLAATPDTVVLAPDGRVVLTGIPTAFPTDDLRDLGTTLFTAVEGRVPDTGSQALPRMADGSPLAAPATGSMTGGPTGSSPLAPLVEGLLAADPAHRPDATSVRLALEKVSPRPRAVRLRSPLVAVAALVTALAVVAGVVLWFLPSSSDPAPSAEKQAPPAEPASFRAVPRPCGLLSKERLADLYLTDRPFTDGTAECGWGSAEDAGTPTNLRHQLSYTIRIFPPRPDGSEKKRAHEAFATAFAAATRNAGTDTDGALRSKPVLVEGIGQEAFSGTLDADYEHAVGITFRVGNLLVTLEYQRGGGQNSSGQTEKGAAEAAKWIAEALARGR